MNVRMDVSNCKRFSIRRHGRGSVCLGPNSEQHIWYAYVVCQFQFLTWSVKLLEICDFERAQDRTHNSDNPFSCSQSSTSGNFKRHERTYSGYKPFSCSKCDNKSSISSHLKRHEITRAPFSCSQCDKNGQPQANLRDLKEPRAFINHSAAPSP